MLKKIITAVASAAVVAGVLLSAPAFAAGVDIKGSGSSFANNAIQACRAAYDTNTVTYTSTGSGTGRSNFASTTLGYDYGASDAVYTSGFPTTSYTTVPLFGGPVVFAYTAVGINDGLNLTAKNVSDIYKGVVTKWNDASIKENNPKVKLPNKTIKVLYRSDSSGTSENVSKYLMQNVPDAGWAQKSTFSQANTIVGTGYSGSAAVASTLEDMVNGFAYFDLSDAITRDVAIAKLKNVAGAFVVPTPSAAAKFINAQPTITNGTDATTGTVNIDFSKSVAGAYQLSILTYGLAPRFVASGSQLKSTDAKKLAVGDFFKYVVGTCIPAKATLLGYVPLGGALKSSALNQIKSIG